MKIYFAFQCHNFQRRVCWMLSSIMQQSIWPFEIVVDIACMENNGDPTTETIAKYFRGLGLDVRLTVIKRKTIFARRGMVRNIQAKNAIKNKSKYIFFADADDVYPIDFFELLNTILNENLNCGKCVYSPYKIHTQIPQTNIMVDKTTKESLYIKDAYVKARELPVFNIPKVLIKNSAAAGCMQVVSVYDMVNNCNGIYSDRLVNDHDMFETGQLARSDRKFRERLGGSLKIRLPEYIHLGHIRDKEIGYHTEAQR